MKKIIFALSLLLLCSCSYLDVVPEGKATEEDIWKTEEQAENYRYYMQTYMPNLIGYDWSPDQFAGDDFITGARGTTYYFSSKSLLYGEENANLTYFGRWAPNCTSGGTNYDIYRGIRYCFYLLDNIYKVPAVSQENADRYAGEAWFLVGYYHQCLLEYYGPIVLVKKFIPIDAPESEILTPRTPYDECVKYIAECYDRAAGLLPDVVGESELGLPTKMAALSYKARLLLYAASPLVNGNSEFYADFVNKDGTHLINQTYDAEKWKRAMDAAKEAIDCVEASKETGAYTMDDRQLGLSVSKSTSTTDPFELGRANYTYIFTGDGNATQFLNQNEYLMSLNKSGSITYTQKQFGCHLANNYTKVSGAYRGYLCPTFEAVQMYYTRNGLPWEDDPETKDIDPLAYNKAAGTVEMHLHKEPRFYASVGYDRGKYAINGEEFILKCRAGEMQGSVLDASKEYQSCTGYILKKWIHRQSAFNYDTKSWTYRKYAYPYIRLAELYLSYAEADFEYNGSLSDASLNYLNLVRRRSGLPDFKDSWALAGGIPTGDELRKVLHRERSIELLMEGMRYHDLRRWKEAGEAMSRRPKAWNLDGRTAADFYRVSTMKESGVRTFESPKTYWMAIPLSEININYNLVQNPGY